MQLSVSRCAVITEDSRKDRSAGSLERRRNASTSSRVSLPNGSTEKAEEARREKKRGMGGVLEGYSAALRRGSESRCLSLTHCNVSTFLSGSANLAASLSNFSLRREGKIVSPRLASPRHSSLRRAVENRLAADAAFFVIAVPAIVSPRSSRRKVCRPAFLSSRLLFGAHTG